MNKELEENNSNNTIKPQRKFLSFTKTKAFERHPSANGLLVKDDSEIKNKIEDTNFFCNVVQEKIIPNNHKLYEFSEADKILDKEITQAIQKGEKEDNIINKINVVKKD